MADHTITYLVEWKPSSTWLTIAAGAVLDVSGADDAGGSADNPFAFGEPPSSRWTVKLLRSAVAGSEWKRRPIRTTITVDGTPTTCVNGIITDYDGSDDGDITFTCETMVVEISTRSRSLYSTVFESRHVATETTTTSVEDPEAIGYLAGPVNWGFWQTGGRPYEQALLYPDADYYYSCDFSLAAPDVAWFAGEDGWQVMLDLAQASGGRIYQDSSGVMRYQQILSVVNAAPSFTFSSRRSQVSEDIAVFGSAKDSGTTEQYATKLVCSYTPRALRPLQEIVRDETLRQIAVGGSVDIPVEPQWPIKVLDAWAEDDLIVATHAGVRITRASGGYTTTTAFYAQHIVVTVTNTLSEPLLVHRLVMRGKPYLAGQQGRTEAGSGETEREYSDSIFIQSEEHARQLCTMALPFYAGIPTVTISGCAMDTRRALGEVVHVYSDELSLSNELAVIVGRHVQNVDTAEYVLALPGNVPVASDFFIVGTTSYTGMSKYVAW